MIKVVILPLALALLSSFSLAESTTNDVMAMCQTNWARTNFATLRDCLDYLVKRDQVVEVDGRTLEEIKVEVLASNDVAPEELDRISGFRFKRQVVKEPVDEEEESGSMSDSMSNSRSKSKSKERDDDDDRRGNNRRRPRPGQGDRQRDRQRDRN